MERVLPPKILELPLGHLSTNPRQRRSISPDSLKNLQREDGGFSVGCGSLGEWMEPRAMGNTKEAFEQAQHALDPFVNMPSKHSVYLFRNCLKKTLTNTCSLY